MAPGELPPGSAEAIRREHINHEASIKAVGFLYYLFTVLLILGGGLGLVAAMQDAPDIPGAQMLLVGAAVFYLVLAVLIGFVGYGLRALLPWGRWLAVGLICVLLLSSLGNVVFTAMANPALVGVAIGSALVGSLIPAYILYLLVSSKGTMVFSPQYKLIIAETPHVKYRTSCIVWGFLIVLGVVLVLAVIGAIVSSMNN